MQVECQLRTHANPLPGVGRLELILEDRIKEDQEIVCETATDETEIDGPCDVTSSFYDVDEDDCTVCTCTRKSKCKNRCYCPCFAEGKLCNEKCHLDQKSCCENKT